MSQDQVIKILKKYKGVWVTTNEIAIRLKISPGTALANLNRCLKYNEVEKVERNNNLTHLWRIK